MEIIFRGKSPDEKPVRFDCTKCKTVFDAYRGKEAVRVFDQRDGDFWQCACTVCAKQCTSAVK